MNLLLWFIFGSFASHRIALLISHEDGPAWVFRKIRKLPPPTSSARRGLACPWCISVWASGLICFLLHFTITLKYSQWFIFWMAVSSGAIAINQQFTQTSR